MPRPPLRVIEPRTTVSSLTIAFENQWVEAFNTATMTWESAFGLLNNEVVFGDRAVGPDRVTPLDGVALLHTLEDKATIIAALNAAGIIPPPLRTQILHDPPATAYQIIVRPLDEVGEHLTEANFENYMRSLMEPTVTWETIAPVRGTTPATQDTFTHTIGDLDADTTYAIFFRPRTTALLPWWPTLLIGTTINVRDPIDITPPAPFLDPFAAGDRWLEFVMRPYTSDGSLEYEFYISELPVRPAAGSDGQFVPNPLFSRPFRYPNGQDSITRQVFRADGLFPETTYYIWVRVVAENGNFAWSSPTTMSTLPLLVPPPPNGLGLAGTNEVNIINFENDDEVPLSRVSHDHMIISWSPIRGFAGIPEDTNLPFEGGSSGPDGSDGAQILGSELIDYMYMVLFSDLTPNRGYWVRVRTIYSVHRAGVGGEITERIDYELQFANNPDFRDAITVFVMPDADEIAPGLHVRMTISDWAGPLQFFTTRHDGEYDGDVIAELYPLPVRDFEIIYTASTRTLLWRFRHTGFDQLGHRDNLADQRFISRLIQQRVFEYTIDMSDYHSMPVSNRVIEIPYSIISAFNDRGIDLTIIAGDTRYTFSPGFAATGLATGPQNVGFGINSQMQILISDIPTQPRLPDNQTFLTPIQNVSVSIDGLGSRTTLNTLAVPISVAHRINRAVAMDFNVGAYVQTSSDATFRRTAGIYDDFMGSITTTTTRMGSFAAISTAIPVPFNAPTHMLNALYYVNSVVAIEDMTWFVPDMPINAWQINRMVLAIATNARTVAINDDLTQQEHHVLVNSRMLVPGADTVAREDALSALVRLYEVRTGQRVRGEPTLYTTLFPDIIDASTSEMQQALLKAELLGFLDYSVLRADPLNPMTMGEAMLIFEIILRN
jgi:hypothetical protein